MDGPMTEVELVPEKEQIENGKEGGPVFHCEHYDTEIVHKIAQVFLPGLATACIDNTTGDMFRSPGSVAADIRKEMVDYLTQRSESFVAESVLLEGGADAEVSDHPFDIISDFVDDFASSKRNLFSRVSGWLLSETREDKIDDFVQEMDINAFWLIDKRESLASTLLKNVDFKDMFHCNKKFSTLEELGDHVVNCGFRSMNCTNEGCTVVFCASQMEKHDSVCPFKIIPCEQKCPENIMRQEMDRHCITVCPMKLVNCPFYAVGCESSIPQCKIQQHRTDDLHSHVLHTLKIMHKGVPVEDLKHRADQILKAQSSSDVLAEARDVRTLSHIIKDVEAKLGPLEIAAVKKDGEESITTTSDSTVESTEDVNKVGDEVTDKVVKTPVTGVNEVSDEFTEVKI